MWSMISMPGNIDGFRPNHFVVLHNISERPAGSDTDLHASRGHAQGNKQEKQSWALLEDSSGNSCLSEEEWPSRPQQGDGSTPASPKLSPVNSTHNAKVLTATGFPDTASHQKSRICSKHFKNGKPDTRTRLNTCTLGMVSGHHLQGNHLRFDMPYSHHHHGYKKRNMANKITWSDYKKHNTVKYLIGTTPNFNRRIKWFTILKNTVPVNMVPILDDIVMVCAALCNL
ncbi:hypothetical protein Bbelb_050950 [Branchiostoma belcheri]|nr:hypothetical protein Bbelb_050950 [Branchiostoma belcheri]